MKTKNQTPAFNEEVSYMRLFPDTEFNNLTSAYTRDGQGAFFVSLMNIVTDENKIDPGISALDLKLRRPDLWELKITQKNADVEEPYLQKAIEVVYKQFQNLSINENWESLATNSKISFIPYAQPVQQIIAGLKTYSTSLGEYAPFFAKDGYDDALTIYAVSGLSQYQVDSLVSVSEPTVVEPVKFLIRTVLTHDEMLELIYNGEAHSDTEALGKLFINLDDPTLPLRYVASIDGKAASFENMTASRMKRIQDFLILTTGTDWAYSSLNAVLTSEGIWKEADAVETEEARIVRIADNLLRLAKLSYMSEMLEIVPEKIQILGQAQNSLKGITNVPYQQTNDSSKQPKKDEQILDGLYSAKGIASITPEQLKNPEQSQRNVLLPVVHKLGVTLSDLDTYLEFFSIEQLGIEELFDLVQFSEKLNESGMKLREFITILIADQQYDTLASTFDAWLKNTCEKLNTTEQSYQLGSEQHNEHLQQLLFEQWTHELAVYWGDKNTSVYNVFWGISEQLNRTKTEEEQGGISKLNTFIRDTESDKQYGFLKSIYSFVSLVNQLSMDGASVQYVGNFLLHLDQENWKVQGFDKVDVLTILQFNHLYKQIEASQQTDFIKGLSQETFGKQDLIALIENNTHWPQESVTELLNSWEVADEDNSLEAVISWLEKLSYCFSVADASTLDAKDLLSYLNALQPETWERLTQLADAFIDSIKAKKDEAIHTKYREAYGIQLEKDRNRLVPTTLGYVHALYEDIATPDHLSDYLLIDVEMSGVMNITPLREATDAVQTYLMRCKSGQERVDLEKLKTITPSEWEWIPNFRIWQAEQNLRTYPENYLQATVRTTATDQFKQLLDTIQKDELTEDLAKEGILNYVDAWYNLENAEIVDVSAYITHSAYFDKEVETIFFISRSQVVAGTFYYCWRDTDPDTQEVHWTPWQLIGQKINAETVSGIYAFNRFNVFWSEGHEKVENNPKTSEKSTTHSLAIKGIYQNLNGSWTAPKVIIDYKIGEAVWKQKNRWEKVGLYQGFGNLRGECIIMIHAYINETSPQYISLISQSLNRSYPNLFWHYTSSEFKNRPIAIEDDKTNKIKVSYEKYSSFLTENSEDCYPQLSKNNPSIHWMAVRNLPKAMFVNIASGESFLLKTPANLEEAKPFYINDNVVAYQKGANSQLPEMSTYRISNATINYLKAEVHKKGVIVLDRSIQIEKIGQPKTSFDEMFDPENIIPPKENSNNKINFEGAYGIYARELFFHAPMAVGDLLSKSLQYEAARNWYHKVYNSLGVASTPETLKEVWQYGPFYEFEPQSQNIELTLTYKDEIEINGLHSFSSTDIPDGTLGAFMDEDNYVYYVTIDKEGNVDMEDVFPSDSDQFSGNLLPIYFDGKQTIILNGSKENEKKESGVFSIVRKGNSWEMIAGTIDVEYSYCTGITVDSSGEKDAIIIAGVTYSNFIILQISDDLAEWKYVKIESPESLRIKSSTYPSITYSKDRKELCLAYINFDGYVTLSVSKDGGKTWEEPISTIIKSDKISITSGTSGYYLGAAQNSDSFFIFYSDSIKGEWRQLKSIVISDDLPENEFPQLKYNANTEQLTLTYCNTKNMLNYEVYSVSYLEEKNISLDPDIIAENNLPVYMKWILEEYIRYLLQFGDNEFRQETWESLSAATQLYFEAEDVLGEEPDIEDLVTKYEGNNRFYEEVKDISEHFGTATNEHLKTLWDLLKDRLYKLRNGLNINGERQMPSMYGSRVDPAQLVLAAQHGGINPYAESQLKNDNTVYRFRDLLPHTESMINMVISFGSELYSALQQQDGEQLQLLQATHQVNLLNVVTEVLDLQIEEATKEVSGLTVNLTSIENQRNYYAHLIEQGNLALETKSIASNQASIAGFIAGSEIRGAAIAAHLIPTIFGFSDGGFQPGSSVDSAAQISGEVAQAAQTTSQILTVEAEYQRRKEEWNFQLQQADYEVQQISAMLEAASQRLNIARANKKQHELSIKQSIEIVNYLNVKFTNQELYSWMSGQLSSLYFTSYQLAFGALHTLQKAYQYELDEQTNFIPANNWDSLRKGLLAGETLRLTLARMQDAYLNNNKRRQNVEAIISLKQFLGENGWKEVKFSMTKELLNTSGNIVKIKSITVSIPAVIGPYETFGATLTNDTTNEKITISKGINDMGVFPDEVNDGRYLPFEGIKIENEGKEDWIFQCERFADSISDVIITVAFTTV